MKGWKKHSNLSLQKLNFYFRVSSFTTNALQNSINRMLHIAHMYSEYTFMDVSTHLSLVNATTKYTMIQTLHGTKLARHAIYQVRLHKCNANTPF